MMDLKNLSKLKDKTTAKRLYDILLLDIFDLFEEFLEIYYCFFDIDEDENIVIL